MRVGPMHGGLERAAERLPDRPALQALDRSWTFGELNALSNGVARHLVEQGVRAGDRVAVMMANRVEFMAAVYGVSKVGAAAVLVSPAWKAIEVGHALELTVPVHAVADALAAPVLTERLGVGQVTDIDDPATAARVLSPAADPGVAVAGTTDAVLVFSSGTTGLPKAVRHTHDSISHATAHWCAALGLGPDDRFQVATPPSHILGLLNLLAAVSAGASVRLHQRFDLDEVLTRIEREAMTLEMAVAPIALAMAGHPGLEDYDLSSLRYIMWGATPVSESVARVVTERTGVRWLPAYGASEVPVIAANPVQRPEQWRLDSAGMAPDGVELRVVDIETGVVLPTGGTGEIQVRGPSVMAGYLPEQETAQAFADGWYRTGDVGWLETEGWVHLTDRLKEMIKVNGFQVAPAELEAVLHGHSAVLDCAVFGIADERAGEVPVAAVQLDPAIAVETGELERLVADNLASYKRLRHVVIVDSVPRLPSGKVLRRVLRDQWTPALVGPGVERLMDVRLSSEQQALRHSAARVVNDLAPPSVAALDDQERVAKLEAAVVAAGWRQLRTGDDDVGPLASAVEVAIVAEEFGRGLADVAFLGPTLAAELRRMAGATPAETAETVALEPRLSGLARAMNEEAPTSVAIDVGGAVSALVLQPSSEHHVLALAALGPIEVGPDLTRPAARLDPSAEVLRVGAPAGPVGDEALTSWMALGLALTCADLVGVMRGAISLACEYAVQRRQYDAPIGSFQAVQHLLADAHVAMEGSRSVALHAAWAVDALPASDALEAADVAKAYCARAARSVCETVIQVHGGIGNTWECLAHVYLRRALQSIATLGDDGASLRRVLVHHGIGDG